jgi:hypothetical protein
MAYIFDLSDQWNASGTTFTAIKMNVTDSASAAASLLMDLQVGGVSQFSVSKAGVVRQPALDFGSSSANFVQNTGEIWARNNTNFADNNGIRLLARGFKAQGSDYFGFAPANALGVAPDVTLFRDAANTLAQRNGVNAQAHNIYNTYTDASNYERGYKRFVSNNFDIGTEAAGTGTVRDVRVRAGTQNWLFLANGGTTFPANSISVLNSFALGRATGVLTLFNESQSAGAAFEYVEQTAPTAPATNRVRVYAEDNGSGKTRLMALFPTGAAVQIAIEP